MIAINREMIEGVFKKSFKKYITALFFIVSGTYIAVRMSFWGINAARSGKVPVAVFCFAFAFFGLLCGCFSILVFSYNRKAYFIINGNKIDSRFGLNNELHEDIKNVTKADVKMGKLTVFFADRIVEIGNLENAKDICGYISAQIAEIRATPDIEITGAQLKESKRKWIISLIPAVLCVLLIFINIIWCVALTNSKEIGEFSQNDDRLFLAFAAAEITTVVLAFVFADRCGKWFNLYNENKSAYLSACAFDHKNDGVGFYTNILGIKYYSDYSYRIIIFAPETDLFAYMLERFDMQTQKWVFCYDSAIGFEILSELYDYIDATFSDVLLVDG